MKAADVMTRNPVYVEPETPIASATRLLHQRRISALPVIDRGGALVGMVTEPDLVRQVEVGTQWHRQRPRWLERLLGADRTAAASADADGRAVHEVMSATVHSIAEHAPVEEIVQVMERHQVGWLPVLRDRNVVGIVSRADILRALASVAPEIKASTASDSSIRAKLLDELASQPWARWVLVNVIVRNGVVHLWGALFDERLRQGIRVAAENTVGVKSVEDHLVWIEPAPDTIVTPPERTLVPS